MRHQSNIVMKKIGMLTAAMVLLMVPVISQAELFGFSKITDNGNVDVGGQLSVDVTAAAGGQVSFIFSNNVGIASSIADIYFDDGPLDGTLLGIANIYDSGAGVAFSSPATPGDLPGGNLASPDFVTTGSLSLDSDPPVSENGVNAADEWVQVLFSLEGGQTFEDTLAALADGSLRIGLHVQAIGTTGGSDSYINRVPEPGTLLLLGSGLLGLVWAGRRRIRK